MKQMTFRKKKMCRRCGGQGRESQDGLFYKVCVGCQGRKVV